MINFLYANEISQSQLRYLAFRDFFIISSQVQGERCDSDVI